MQPGQLAVLQGTVEPGDDENGPAAKDVQPCLGGVQASQRRRSQRERLARHEAREFRWVGLEDVRARHPTDRTCPPAVSLY